MDIRIEERAWRRCLVMTSCTYDRSQESMLGREQEPSNEEFVWEDQLSMMSGDVQPLRLASYPGRRHLDRRDAVSLPGPGAISPKPESRAGIHGVVPIRCIAVPS